MGPMSLTEYQEERRSGCRQSCTTPFLDVQVNRAHEQCRSRVLTLIVQRLGEDAKIKQLVSKHVV